jgi:hypothetical protein
MNKISIMLNHTPADIEGSWKPQWENNYTFNISQKGEDFKLAFLLFTTPTDTSNYNVDYKDIIEEKISNAYRETHLFITVA